MIDENCLAAAEPEGEIRENERAGILNGQCRGVEIADGESEPARVGGACVVLDARDVVGGWTQADVDEVGVGVEPDAWTHVDPGEGELAACAGVFQGDTFVGGDLIRAAGEIRRVNVEDFVEGLIAGAEIAVGGVR